MNTLVKIIRILHLAPKAKQEKDFEDRLFDAFCIR